MACACRTPEWLKKMFASVTNSERNGPVFRFFMDLGDAGIVPNKQTGWFYWLLVTLDLKK